MRYYGRSCNEVSRDKKNRTKTSGRRYALHPVKHIVYFVMNEHLKFDWDDDKLAANIQEHRLHFETAKFVWQDPLRIFREDDSGNEKKAYYGESTKHTKNWRPANEGNVTGS
jgi:hypothetical protein